MVFRIAVLVLLGSLLSGCGGGGGDGGPQGGGPSEFRLSLDRSALTFSTTAGNVPPTQTIVATWTGTPPDPVYVTATVEGTGIAPNIPVVIGQSSATATVSVSAGLAAGTYTGQINFLACRDAACAQRVGGAPLPVSFTINVAAGAGFVSPESLSYQHVSGNSLPMPRRLQVLSDAGAWTAKSNAAWLRTSVSSGQGGGFFDVSLAPDVAVPGTSSATLTVTSSLRGTQVIPVTLNLISPANPTTPPRGDAGSGEFTLSATNVSFATRRFTTPAAQALQVHWLDNAATSLGAAFVASAPDWLSVQVIGQAPDYQLRLQVTDSSKAIGTYSAVLAVGTIDAAGNVLHRRDVNVSLRVFGVITASAPSIAPSFILGSSNSSSAATVRVATDPSTRWSVTSSVPWVTTSVDSGTSSGSVAVIVDSSALDIGTFAGTVTFTNADDPTNTVAIPVSANVTAPTLSVTSGPVVIGGADGLDPGGVNIPVSINTGDNSYPLSATATTANGDAWLIVPTVPVQVRAAPTNIAINADRSLVDAGVHEGNVTLQITVRGRVYSRSIPIVLKEEGHWLQLSSRGAAFSNFPGRSVLSRSIQVASSRGNIDVPWSATSDANWLTVTATGNTGGSVVLTANPAGLQQDTLHLATVTIESSDPEIGNQESIRVAFWAGSTDPQDLTIGGVHRNPVANPVEPWVYVNDGANTIEIYNVYTGALVDTWSTTLVGAGVMTINRDGTLLLVNDEGAHAVIALNARTGGIVRTYSYNQNLDVRSVTHIDVGSRAVLISSLGRVYDVATGAELGPYVLPVGGTTSFAVDPLSRYFVTLDTGRSPASIEKFSIKRTALTEDGIAIAWAAGTSGTGSDGQDSCLSNDGTRLFTVMSAPYNFAMYRPNGTVFQYLGALPASAYPNNAECGWSGIFVGGAQTYSMSNDTWIYRSDDSLLTSFHMSASSRWLVLSGDNVRVIGATAVPSLVFKNIPAP